MMQINKSERQQLEEMGILKQTQGRYRHMNICSIHKNSKGKSCFIEDWLIIFLNPDKYREAMKGYMSQGRIESIIRDVLRGNYQVY